MYFEVLFPLKYLTAIVLAGSEKLGEWVISAGLLRDIG